MKNKHLISILLCVMLIFFMGINSNAYSSSNKWPSINGKQLSQKEKIDDFEYMYNILKDNYAFFYVNKRTHGIDWLSKKNEFIKKIKATKNDSEFFDCMSDILAQLNNGHTHMYNQDDYTYWKGLVLDWGGWNDAWLNQLNNEKTLKRYLQKNNNNSVSFLHAYSTHAELAVRNNINIGANIIGNDSDLSNGNVTTEILQKDKVAYLKVKGFDYYNIKRDLKIIKPFFYKVRNYKKLIIDIRDNGGGNDNYWKNNIVSLLINKPLKATEYSVYRGGSFEEDFIRDIQEVGYEGLEPISNIKKEKLKNPPPELNKDFKYYKKNKIVVSPNNSIGFKGKIYLLVNKNIFSSAEAFAIFAKSTGFARLIGETTGGDGIVGCVPLCSLPNSGFVFGFSMTMGLTSDGSCNFEKKTKPDIEISQKWYDNLVHDRSIQYVLNGKDQFISAVEMLRIGIIVALIIAALIIVVFLKIKFRLGFYLRKTKKVN